MTAAILILPTSFQRAALSQDIRAWVDANENPVKVQGSSVIGIQREGMSLSGHAG